MLAKLLAVFAMVAAALVGGWIFLDHPGSSDFEGSWVLTSATYAGEPVQLLDTHPITLVIDHDQAGGRSACNEYGTDFAHDGDEVTFTEFFSTAMACLPEAVMELEASYSRALGAVRHADRDGDTLTLTGDGVTLVFTGGVAP